MKKSSFLKVLSVFLILILTGAGSVCWKIYYQKNKIQKLQAPEQPLQLDILRSAYKDVLFEAEYDDEKQDFCITVTAPVFVNTQNFKSRKFYWADGRMLPESELKNKDKYWKLIYPYERGIRDPLALSEEEIERVRNFSSKENRLDSSGTPMFFFDFLYGASSQLIIEDHVKHTTFLGKKTRVHERIEQPLKNVEERLYALARISPEVQSFVNDLKSADAYSWRIIDGTNRKSFHSYGIAVDLLPKKLGGKAIFWNWTRDKDPKNWMLTPLSKRWIPPAAVIEIFANQGFIWGGNWVIFDNMHFEYHPELLVSKN